MVTKKEAREELQEEIFKAMNKYHKHMISIRTKRGIEAKRKKND